MELKLKRIVRTRQELETLEMYDVTPPGDLFVPLLRNLRHINAALEDYDEVMSRVIREVGEPHQGGYRIPPDDTEASLSYDRTRQEALESTVSVDIHPIALSRFIKARKEKKGYDIPMHVLRRLDYLVEIDDAAMDMMTEIENTPDD